MRDANYLKFLREEGRCHACQSQGYRVVRGDQIGRGACDPAHGPVNGKGSKGPDNEAVPLCRVHHDEQHSLTWPAFEAKYGFSRATEAKVWFTAYTIWREATS